MDSHISLLRAWFPSTYDVSGTGAHWVVSRCEILFWAVSAWSLCMCKSQLQTEQLKKKLTWWMIMLQDANALRVMLTREFEIRNEIRKAASNSQGPNTDLMLAASQGCDLCTRELIKAGAEVNFANKDGCTALMHAAQNGHDLCARALIANGAVVNAQANNGFSALMLACHNGHEQCARALIENGADLEKQTKKGNTALILAYQNGHEQCARALSTIRWISTAAARNSMPFRSKAVGA